MTVHISNLWLFLVHVNMWAVMHCSAGFRGSDLMTGRSDGFVCLTEDGGGRHWMAVSLRNLHREGFVPVLASQRQSRSGDHTAQYVHTCMHVCSLSSLVCWWRLCLCVCKGTLDHWPKLGKHKMEIRHVQVQCLCSILACNMPWLIFVTFPAYDIPQSSAYSFWILYFWKEVHYFLNVSFSLFFYV